MHNPAAAQSTDDTGQIPALFGGTDGTELPQAAGERPQFERIQQSREFIALRRTLRRFIFPVSALFFAWYMTYVLLSAYAHEFMSIKLLGEINVAIVMGLLQFVTTLIITLTYVRFAKNRIDPHVENIRKQTGVSEK